MHALHAILVYVGDMLSCDSINLKGYARVQAIGATENYFNKAFDWRTIEDAGRWSDEFPGEGVVLGKEEPQRLIELVKTYSQKPLEMALYYLNYALTKPAWYDKETIAARGLRVLNDTPFYAPDGRALFQAGRPLTQLQIDSEFLRKAWDGDPEVLNILWCLRQALALVDDEYTFDSRFYSVPDGSPRLSTETLEDLNRHPEHYALVFSDYHY